MYRLMPPQSRSWQVPGQTLSQLPPRQKLPSDCGSTNTEPSFDPPHAYTRDTLRALAPANLHINMEYRNHDSPGTVTMFSPTDVINNTWAVTCTNGHQGAIDVAREVSKHLRALQWAFPTNKLARDSHVQLLEDLHSAPILEELHISERILDLNERFSRSGTCAPQICELISRLLCLRRCRIEGSILTGHFLNILPSLLLLQDLSIYSVYRRVFHPACDLEDAEREEPDSTVDMPWLKLPNLRKFDLRYICKHFTMGQLIPDGLTALRIEFFGGEERINPGDLGWLVQHCPKLERLELDMGSLVDFNDNQAKLSESSSAASTQLSDMFRKLRGFRHLRTLRLFPSYWFRQKLLSNPFADDDGVASSIKIFSQLRSECSSLRTLIICISFGEYPFDIVPRMSLSIRPVKYVLRAIGAHDDVLVRWGYGASDEIYEVAYQGDTALPGSKTILVSAKSFFDDLSSDWLLPHYELER